MQLFNYVEVNIFAMTVLFLVFLNIRNSSEKYTIDQKLFIALVASNALILVTDTLMWCINGRKGFYARNINLIGTSIYYILNAFPCMLWTIYADYQVYRDEKRMKKYILFFIAPLIVNTIFSIWSAFHNFYFYIDSYNIYHRGKYFAVMPFLCYAYLIYSFVFIKINHNRIEKKHYIPSLVFALPPVTGGIIQALFYGVSLIWACMAISLLIIFINIQNSQLYTDSLTGLYNRRQLDNYLSEKFKAKGMTRTIAGIMIDINSFKDINDKYGHVIGDQALKYTAEILKKSFSREDFVSRYGGDEFVIIADINQDEEIIKLKEKIKRNVDMFNNVSKEPYKISLSVGYDICRIDENSDPKDFIKHIDDLMYKDKKKRK